mmetsp:Transcript_21110/g.50933  ORF Transcript_21110/g.50933 Transcript_21110/m.50933 type:complete len:288 (-) Transcript_21110:594-1457(-)
MRRVGVPLLVGLAGGFGGEGGGEERADLRDQRREEWHVAGQSLDGGGGGRVRRVQRVAQQASQEGDKARAVVEALERLAQRDVHRLGEVEELPLGHGARDGVVPAEREQVRSGAEQLRENLGLRELLGGARVGGGQEDEETQRTHRVPAKRCLLLRRLGELDERRAHLARGAPRVRRLERLGERVERCGAHEVARALQNLGEELLALGGRVARAPGDRPQQPQRHALGLLVRLLVGELDDGGAEVRGEGDHPRSLGEEEERVESLEGPLPLLPVLELALGALALQHL